jgi:hypothetical protein
VEEEMGLRDGRIALGAALSVCAWLAVPSGAQQPAPVTGVEQVIGMAGIKEHAKGSLAIDGGNLQFSNSKAKASVAIASMQDIVTANDSQRAIHGTLGTLTMFAPYGGGRFLSLFRSKLDTLTIQYVDTSGAVHGAIFTMAVGKADALKKQLVALGGHTTIPIEDEKKAPETKPAASKEEKP